MERDVRTNLMMSIWQNKLSQYDPTCYIKSLLVTDQERPSIHLISTSLLDYTLPEYKGCDYIYYR